MSCIGVFRLSLLVLSHLCFLSFLYCLVDFFQFKMKCRDKLCTSFLFSYKAFKDFFTHQEKWIFRVWIPMLACILYNRLQFGLIFYWHQPLYSTELLCEKHWLLCSLPNAVCVLAAWMPSFGWNFFDARIKPQKVEGKNNIESVI